MEHSRGALRLRSNAASHTPEISRRLPIFGDASALLVTYRSMKDMLAPRAAAHRQISGNAHLSYL